MSQAGEITLKAQQSKGKIQSTKDCIEEYLKWKDGMDTYYLSETLAIEWSTFCARVSMLVDEGKVYYDGFCMVHDKSYSIIRYEHDTAKQKERALEVRKAKFLKVLRRLKNDYTDLMMIDTVIAIDLELE